MQSSPTLLQKLKTIATKLKAQHKHQEAEHLYRDLVQLFRQNPASHNNHQIVGELILLLDTKFRTPEPLFFEVLDEIYQHIYDKSVLSPIINIIYDYIPQLLIRFQQFLTSTQEEEIKRLKNVEKPILTIYNHERQSYITYDKSISSNNDIPGSLRDLISTIQSPQVNSVPANHSYASQIPKVLYPEQEEVKYSNKWRIKTLLLAVYQRHIHQASQKSVESFLKLVYVFCGGQHSFSFSLYMLNRPDDFSIFYHRISEEELQWLLVCLYYLYINKKHLKYEVMSAIQLVRKKCGNECKFRVNEVAQSLLHLFQNEYEDIF